MEFEQFYEFYRRKWKIILRFYQENISEYQIPVDKYNCVTMYKDDIYEIIIL